MKVKEILFMITGIVGGIELLMGIAFQVGYLVAFGFILVCLVSWEDGLDNPFKKNNFRRKNK